MTIEWGSKAWVREAAKIERNYEIGAGHLAYHKPKIIKGELMDKESSENKSNEDKFTLKKGTTLVTNVDIEPVNNGWVITIEYDEDEYRRFTFTNLEAMLTFVKDMTGTPIRVRDSK